MAIVFKLRDKELVKALERMTANGLSAGTQYYHTQLKLAVSVSNPGQKVKVKRRRKGGNKRTRTIYPSPSKPGEPPRTRTTFGRSQIKREIDRKNLAARVGITEAGIYMAYLDLGTKHIARRPFFMSTLTKHKSIIARLFTSGGPRI